MDTTAKATRTRLTERPMDAYIASIRTEEEICRIIADAGKRRHQLFMQTLDTQLTDAESGIKLINVSCQGVHDLLDVARRPGEMLEKHLTMVLSVDDVIIEVRLQHRMDYVGVTEIILSPGKGQKRSDRLSGDWFYTSNPLGSYTCQKIVETFGDNANSIIKCLRKIDQCKQSFNMQTYNHL